MSRLLRRAPFLIAAVVVGCGGDPASGDDADVADVGEDTAQDVAPDDVGDGDESATDGDTGGIDEDGDTYPAGEDCDDHDPEVIPGSRRPCTSACGTGTERCEGGAWAGCTAPTDCACDAPGSTRVVDCGSCGIASQRCDPSGVWEPPGTCMDEGECAEGTVETEACGFCGTRSRICDAACAWRPWGDCEGPGDCDPAMSSTITSDGCSPGLAQQRACSPTCAWVTLVPCTADCILEPRTGSFADETCIQGGPFLMGTDIPQHVDDDNTPVHLVVLSPYFIDTYKVTNARYRACVAAGACTPPSTSWDLVTYHWSPEADYAPHPVTGVSWLQAAAFCAWDEGRMLPTEAQWEKAAKGPAPRQVPYAWGDDTDPCPYTNAQACRTSESFPVDAYPGGVSYWGVRQMGGNGFEWTRDYFAADYYSSSPAVDPEGPASGADRAYHSMHQARALWRDQYESIAARGNTVETNDMYYFGFRCARPML